MGKISPRIGVTLPLTCPTLPVGHALEIFVGWGFLGAGGAGTFIRTFSWSESSSPSERLSESEQNGG
jgi:hypothetical protein